MKKIRIFSMAILLVVSVTALSSCAALDGVLLFGEDVFDAVFGAIDNGPLGKFYDTLDIEGWITGENGGNFENSDNEGGSSELKVVSIALDSTNAKTEFKYAEKFTADGLKVVATMSDSSTKEISLNDVTIRTPDTKSPGVRIVTVTYSGVSARYEVTVNPKVYAPISEVSLVNIASKNTSTPYRVEAELIDMVTPGVLKAEGVDSFVADAPSDADVTSGGQYLTGFGVSMNYFGFTFNSAEKYENVTIVLRVANSSGHSIEVGSEIKMYLNLAQEDNGYISGEIPLVGYIVQANDAGKWSDIVIRGITIPEGANTLTFEVQGDLAYDLDYVDFYVGMSYINSVVEIKNTDKVVKDIETLDTEKAFTRQDVADAKGLEDGELFVEPVTKEWPNGIPTSGGKSVGAIAKGSLISTTLRLAEDATIRILFKASKTTADNASYYVDNNWNFYIDGVKLGFVEYVDIRGGDRSQSMYWEWKYTNLGEINLPAGDHSFVIEAVGVDCNVDTVEFEVISLGSYDSIGKGLDEQEGDDNRVFKIENNGIYIEAESLSIDNLVPETSNGVSIESFTGGQGIAAIKGGYQSFVVVSDKDVTVRLSVNFAKKAGGNILSYIPSISVNGSNITLSGGTLPAGVSGNQYWNLAEIALATIELKANVEYEFKVNFKSGNLDKYIFTVVDGDGQQIPDDNADVTVATSGVTKYELENIDNTQCDIITRQDFVNANICVQGDVGRGDGRIYGFEDGSVFRVYVKVTAPATLKISIAGYADTSKDGNPNIAAYSWKFGDTTITPAADSAIPTNKVVGEAVVGTVNVTEAGIYVFEFDFGKRTDLDYIAFEVV